MHPLFTLIFTHDIIVTVSKGSRRCSYRFYNSNGKNYAQCIYQSVWVQGILTAYEIGSILTSSDLGITELIHQGYTVTCSPIKKSTSKDEIQNALLGTFL